MRFDKFTIKSQEALNESQQVAERYEHQQIEPEHLLLAILEQGNGIAGSVLKKLGADPQVISAELAQALQKLPKVSGPGVSLSHISPRLNKILDISFKEAQRLNDEYVSIEHILLSIVEASDTRAAKILASCGVTKDILFKP